MYKHIYIHSHISAKFLTVYSREMRISILENSPIKYTRNQMACTYIYFFVQVIGKNKTYPRETSQMTILNIKLHIPYQRSLKASYMKEEFASMADVLYTSFCDLLSSSYRDFFVQSILSVSPGKEETTTKLLLQENDENKEHTGATYSNIPNR